MNEIQKIFDTKLYFDLEEEDYIKIQNYINNLQSKIDKLDNENFELAKRIHNTKKIVNKVKKVSDYMNEIACDDLLNALEGK